MVDCETCSVWKVQGWGHYRKCHNNGASGKEQDHTTTGAAARLNRAPSSVGARAHHQTPAA